MRREADFFQDREMDLVYIAKKLKEALRLESAFTESTTTRGGFGRRLARS